MESDDNRDGEHRTGKGFDNEDWGAGVQEAESFHNGRPTHKSPEVKSLQKESTLAKIGKAIAIIIVAAIGLAFILLWLYISLTRELG